MKQSCNTSVVLCGTRRRLHHGECFCVTSADDRHLNHHAAFGHMGVSKNRGNNSQNGWFIMVSNPIKMDDFD